MKSFSAGERIPIGLFLLWLWKSEQAFIRKPSERLHPTDPTDANSPHFMLFACLPPPRFLRGIPSADWRSVKRIKNLVLKATKRAVPASSGPSVSGSARRVLRVWVVDDNAALRELFAHLLTKQSGLRCTRQFPSAAGVLAALEEERPPDTILLDVHLGRHSGLSAIRTIKQLAPTVKVLMLTMFNNSHYEQEAFESGASGFLLKTYGLDEIAKLIQAAHANPGAPDLFPNRALQQQLELSRAATAAVGSTRRFSFVGALRRLCSSPRRQTAS
jgi:DNA-binding NarL/FixJ family response regulator